MGSRNRVILVLPENRLWKRKRKWYVTKILWNFSRDILDQHIQKSELSNQMEAFGVDFSEAYFLEAFMKFQNSHFAADHFQKSLCQTPLEDAQRAEILHVSRVQIDTKSHKISGHVIIGFSKCQGLNFKKGIGCPPPPILAGLIGKFLQCFINLCGTYCL